MNLLPFFGFLILFGKVAWYEVENYDHWLPKVIWLGGSVLASAICAILLKLVSGWMGF